MATIKSFEELEIWKKARNLNRQILKISQREPIRKDLRFYSQIRAAAGSVMDISPKGLKEIVALNLLII